jgi:hypothetical protein
VHATLLAFLDGPCGRDWAARAARTSRLAAPSGGVASAGLRTPTSGWARRVACRAGLFAACARLPPAADTTPACRR